jgi:lysophospholipase L1-like esterase
MSSPDRRGWRNRQPKRLSRPAAALLAVAVLTVVILAVVLTAGGSSGPSYPASAHTASGDSPRRSSSGADSPTYYLALGDSLAKGVGASEEQRDYVNLIYAHEASHYGDLRLWNLGCGGATTRSLRFGPGCGEGTQLGDAEALLRSNLGHVAFVTIDIGGNDLIACIDGPTVNARCVEEAFRAISTNLPKVLAGLRSAYPGIRIYGMDYYDPYLADWLLGIAGQNMAEETVDVIGELNAELGRIYAAAGVAMADPFSAFNSRDFSVTGSYNGGKVPENVAIVCEWTHMCSSRNVHTDDTGHAVLAETFESLINRDSVTPPAISTSKLPPASVAGSYSAVLSASGGATPYEWSLDGSLPPGLRLVGATGVISGRLSAKAKGIYTFRVRVIDQAEVARAAVRNLSITVPLRRRTRRRSAR